MLVRPSARAQGRDLLTRPAYGRPTRCEDAPPKSPEARRQFTRTEPSLEGVWGLCDVAPLTGARNRTPNAPPHTRRRGSTGNRIQFARALASQRPPSRERPPLGGGGAGRAPSPSLCVSPRSRSIDDAEHRRRPVRGPPACSSAGTSLRARRRRRRPYAKNHNCRRFRRPDDGPAVPSGPGPATMASRGRGAHGVEDPSAGLPSLGEVPQGRSPAATCCVYGPRRGPSTTPQKTGFEPHELNSCVGGAKS